MDALIPLFSGRETKRVSFTGKGDEYFRIWMVNLALSVVTLGVFSAWAKVRRQQYFYRHTHLDDATFDYHGQPLAILKGRLLGIALLALYALSGVGGPLVTFGVIVAIGLVMPWLLAQSLRFQLRNVSYRGLRFQFTGTTREAYVTFLGFGLLTLVTFGLAWPLWYLRIKLYQHGNAAYGRSRFAMTATAVEVYGVWFGVVLAGVAVGFAAMVLALGATFLASLFGGLFTTGEPANLFNSIVVGIIGLLFVALYLTATVVLRAMLMVRLRSLIWGQTSLGDHRLGCDMDLRRYIWIDVSNVFLTIVTIGFYRPFAQIRQTAYLLECTRLEAAGPLDQFQTAEGDEPGAAGTEIAGLFDFDVSF